MMMCCIVGLRTSLLLVDSSLYLSDFLSSYTFNNEIFVKDFCETMQARVVTFDMQTVDNVLYVLYWPSPDNFSHICPIFFLSIL